MPTDPDTAFHHAIATHKAAYEAERAAEALSSARLEVERRELEVSDRRLQIEAEVVDLQRSRLETALVIGIERLSWAQGALARIERENSLETA